MALGTVTLVKSGVVGDLKYAILDVVPTSGANYTTNGEPFDVAQIPGAPSNANLYVVDCGPSSGVGTASATLTWDAANKKLKAYGTAGSATGLTEIAASTNLSTQTARIIAYYK